MLKEAQEGVKGGTLAGGSPFAGGSAARSPRDPVGLAVDEGKGRRGRRPLQGWCGDTGPAVIPASGRGWNPAPTGGWRTGVGSAETVAAGRRGRRPLQGGCDAITAAVIPRRAGVEPRPYRGLAERGRAGGGRRKGSSRTPTPTAGGKRAACRRIYCDIIPRLGRGWRNVVTPAKTVTAGRRGRRPLQGGCGDVSGGDSRRAGAEPRPTTDPWLYRLSTFFTQSRR